MIAAVKFYFFPPQNYEKQCADGGLEACFFAIDFKPFNALENEQNRLKNACANDDKLACEFANFITQPSARDDLNLLKRFCDEHFSLACYFLSAKDDEIRKKNCYENKFALSCKELAKELAEKNEFSKLITPLKIACESYDINSCVNLWRMYNHGIGVAQDKQKAVVLARIVNILKEKK